jgi:hypothetical protein
LTKPFIFIVLFGILLLIIGIVAGKWERPYYPYSESSYAEMYYDDEEAVKTIPLTSALVYYNITYLNYSLSNDGILEYNNSRMRVLRNGTYQVIVSVTIGGGTGKVYEVALFKNSAETEACENHIRTNNNADEQNMAFNCIINSNYYDNFSLMAKTYTSPVINMEIHELSWTMIQIK